MHVLLMLLRSAAYTALMAFEILMIARAIFSIIPLFGETGEKLASVIYVLTEPAILPMRMLLSVFDMEYFPIDIPFYLTFLAASLASSLLF